MKAPHRIRAEMCATCPFRPGVPAKYAAVRPVIAHSALTEAARICHSTGSNNAFHRRTGKPPAICRGARDLQLRLFASMGVIAAPTDEAWAAQCRAMKLPAPITLPPET
jgi:hypothetical protein